LRRGGLKGIMEDLGKKNRFDIRGSAVAMGTRRVVGGKKERKLSLGRRFGEKKTPKQKWANESRLGSPGRKVTKRDTGGEEKVLAGNRGGAVGKGRLHFLPWGARAL